MAAEVLRIANLREVAGCQRSADASGRSRSRHEGVLHNKFCRSIGLGRIIWIGQINLFLKYQKMIRWSCKDVTYMRYLIIQFRWVLVVRVNSYRWFSVHHVRSWLAFKIVVLVFVASSVILGLGPSLILAVAKMSGLVTRCAYRTSTGNLGPSQIGNAPMWIAGLLLNWLIDIRNIHR